MNENVDRLIAYQTEDDSWSLAVVSSSTYTHILKDLDTGIGTMNIVDYTEGCYHPIEGVPYDEVVCSYQEYADEHIPSVLLVVPYVII